MIEVTVKELAYWNNRTYGSAYIIKKNWIKAAIIVLCILTPGTNWAIPFIGKFIKADLIFRF